jgi:hypothetical protein
MNTANWMRWTMFNHPQSRGKAKLTMEVARAMFVRKWPDGESVIEAGVRNICADGARIRSKSALTPPVTNNNVRINHG